MDANTFFLIASMVPVVIGLILLEGINSTPRHRRGGGIEESVERKMRILTSGLGHSSAMRFKKDIESDTNYNQGHEERPDESRDK